MTKRNRKPTGFYGDNYWQTADWNQRAFQAYRQQIVQLAMSRCKWLNLPETCDERYLEFLLCTRGVASIAYPEGMPMMFFTNMANLNGRWNVYDTPSKWEAIGNNGWRFQASHKTGTLVYDSRLRIPNYTQIEYFARRLANLDRVEDINLSHQRTPYIITAPREDANDAKQVLKQITGGELAILAKKGFSDNIKVEAINTNVSYLGNEIAERKISLWEEVYTFLGISHVGQKSERLTSEEVSASNEPSNLMALDALNARRDAANKLNAMFGLDVHVVWRKDNESDVYNFLRNPLINENLLANEGRNSTNEGIEGTHE